MRLTMAQMNPVVGDITGNVTRLLDTVASASKEGSVTELPFDDDTFVWAGSMDCVGYLPLEPAPLLSELARVVRPGGRVAILAWSSEKLLPGYPLL